MNKVEIIADSTNKFGQRITSAILTFPRYLLAEVNTHRMLSRNSASSRAIRFEKMVKSVMENPFIPFKWQKDHAGMQGTEYFTDALDVDNCRTFWLKARNDAVSWAKILNTKGVTKQICNRLLEPFMYHTALVTGTEMENFFALRAQDAAEIHFQDLAYKYLEAMNLSEPKRLKAGEWHIPFGDRPELGDYIYEYAAGKGLMDVGNTDEAYHQRRRIHDEIAIKLATVRCARISYHVPGAEQKIDIEADLKLHDRLSQSGHWSAFEHCAKAMSEEEYYGHFSGRLRTQEDSWPNWDKYTAKYGEKGRVVDDPECEDKVRLIHEQGLKHEDPQFGWCGNFRGFIQYRKMFTDENRKDDRLIKK